ncbi:DsbA family protein [Novosphingobium bradum]|uniref:DsbA family protein n=1 Tax=Novosphingobium bradum TaxID=1737444 RepID=A0ABV7IPC4_9SPHN
MSPKRVIAAFLALVALAAPQLGAAASAAPTLAVAATPRGSHVLGRANAPLKVVEYVSYTCPHCAAFEREAADPLLDMVARSGRGTVEYRPMMRNIVDVAATLMAGCGPVSRFPGNHAALLRGQDKWLVPPQNSQPDRWRTGSFLARMQAVAQDMNLYTLFEERGYTRAELDRCLANEAQANAFAAENRQAMAGLNLKGTPSFLINGVLQPGNDWASLRPALAAALR